MRVVAAGGGTGGHLYPAIAIIEALKKRCDCEILYIGTKHGIEARVIPEKGYMFQTIWISGLQRGRVARNFLFPLKMLVSFVQALVIVARFKPDVVLGTGGYAAWPVLTAAVLLGKRRIIQEQNLKPGLVTRLLAPRMDAVHVSFEASKKFFTKKSHLAVSGNPTLDDLEEATREAGYRHFEPSPTKTTLFVFGGSQGARSINQAVLHSLPHLMKNKRVQILWAAGPKWAESVRKGCETFGNRVRIFPYIQEMGMAYRVSDLVICRSGATTVAEIARLGILAVLVPFPGAAGGHQEENARVLVEAGAAEIVLDVQLAERLETVITGLLKDGKRRMEMRRNIKALGMPRAAQTIAGDILSRTRARN